MSDIVSIFRTFQERYFPKSDLPFENWTEFGESDKLYFVRYQSHCFVVLYYASSRIGHVADGGNLFRSDSEIAAGLRHLLNIRLRSCEFNQQSKLDHCSSSAVLIGLELLRAYLLKQRPVILISPSSWKKSIVKHMHHYDSVTIEHPPFHSLRKRLTCSKCNASYKQTQRRAYFSHLFKCSKSE